LLKNSRGFTEILRVNKKRFAGGLFWQPVAVGYTARNYARDLARESRANYFVEYRSMIGLAPRRRGYRAGMPSIAAEVVDALSEYTSFLAVFAVDKKYYLLAVRNSIILADKLFESETDARAEYARFAKIPDWTAFIAPNSWGMPRAMERNLGTLLSRKTKYNLRPISRWRSNFVSLVLLLAFFAVLYMFFREPINQMKTPKVKPLDPARIEEYKRLVDEKNKELDKQFEIVKEEKNPLVLPYSSLPVPDARAKQCYQAIGFLMQPVTGWVQSNVVCDETRATAEFNRKYGSLDEFYQIASDFLPGAEVVELDDNTLSVSVALPEVERVASQDARDAETIERNVISLFQTMRMNAKTDIVVDTLSNNDDTQSLNVVEIATSSKLLPMQFIKMFEDFGGVYMTRCVWNAIARTWNYEVIIYAK
jgi:hypothetical protein